MRCADEWAPTRGLAWTSCAWVRWSRGRSGFSTRAFREWKSHEAWTTHRTLDHRRLFFGHGAQKLFGIFGGRGPRGPADDRDRSAATAARAGQATARLTRGAGGGDARARLAHSARGGTALIGSMVAAIGNVHVPNGLWGRNGYEYNLALIAAMAALIDGRPGQALAGRGARHRVHRPRVDGRVAGGRRRRLHHRNRDGQERRRAIRRRAGRSGRVAAARPAGRRVAAKPRRREAAPAAGAVRQAPERPCGARPTPSTPRAEEQDRVVARLDAVGDAGGVEDEDVVALLALRLRTGQLQPPDLHPLPLGGPGAVGSSTASPSRRSTTSSGTPSGRRADDLLLEIVAPARLRVLVGERPLALLGLEAVAHPALGAVRRRST